MKKIIIALFIASLGLYSCQKGYISDPEADFQPNNHRGYFECLINGEKFEAEAKGVDHNTEDGANIVTISAYAYDYTRRPQDFRNISLAIPNFDGPKEYQFPTEVMGMVLRSFTDVPESIYINGIFDEDSKLNLTQFDEWGVKGTFSFKVVHESNVYDTLFVTDGVFDLPR